MILLLIVLLALVGDVFSACWPRVIGKTEATGCLKDVTLDQIWCSGHRKVQNMREKPWFNAKLVASIQRGTVIKRVHGSCASQSNTSCNGTKVDNVGCAWVDSRCTLPMSKYKSTEYAYVQATGKTGWMAWKNELISLQSLGVGATEEMCKAGDPLPLCQRTTALQMGGWPSNLIPKALCVMKGESGGNPAAMAQNYGSTDVGLMQINNGFGHCAGCGVDPADTLCGKYCWELLDPVAAATCAYKLYQCSPNKFGTWYAYGKNGCSAATKVTTACPLTQSPAPDNDVDEVIPRPPVVSTVPVPVTPDKCPAWLDCGVLSEDCLATHTLDELSQPAFHHNPPTECMPQTDAECGALCNVPPAATPSAQCQLKLRDQFAGDCLPSQACINSGNMYVKNGQCPGRDYCCAEVACSPPDVDTRATPAVNTQCAHIDYCKAKGGKPYPTNLYKFRNECSYHPSSLVVCCEFPANVNHQVWVGNFQSYREDDVEMLEDASSASAIGASVALLVVVSLISMI